MRVFGTSQEPDTLERERSMKKYRFEAKLIKIKINKNAVC